VLCVSRYLRSDIDTISWIEVLAVKHATLCGVALVLLFAGCSTSVSIKNADGSTMSGRMINGSISYSTGAACTPAQPGSAAPLPPITPPPPTVKMMCQGTNCIHVLAAEVPDCRTQIATVKSTDITTYFAWAAGMAFSLWALVK